MTMRWKKGERVCWWTAMDGDCVGMVERYVRIRGRSLVQIRRDNGAVAHERADDLDYATDGARLLGRERER